MLRYPILLLLFILSLLNMAYAQSDASLSFSPQRIVMEGTRSALLSLTNTGGKAGTYRITLVDVLYQDDGSIKHANQAPAGYPSARSLVRISPSQVYLNPQESQSVRVLFDGKRASPNREYRIHVVMQLMPEPTGLTAPANQAQKVSTSVSLNQGVAIPVIIRVGATEAKGDIASVKRTPKGLAVMLTRSGTRSLYTDIETYVGAVVPANRVGLLKGVAVPVPNQRRLIQVGIDKPSTRPYTVVVKDHDTGKVIAQRNVP